MGLTLTTLRCPDAANPESRHAAGGEFTIGRGPDNDWVLPDPDRHLSKRHCVLAYRSGQWQLTDLSSNGTFLNRDTKPLGSGASRPIRDGDRLRLGAYEIEMKVEEEEEALPPPSSAHSVYAAQPGNFTPSMLDPFAEAPPPASSTWGEADPLFGSGMSDAADPHSSLLPADFDPLGGNADGFHGPTRSDHMPAINDAFRPPPRPAVAIPDDWDLSLPGSVPAAPQPVSQPTSQPMPQGRPAVILPEFEPPAPLPVAPPPVAPPPVALPPVAPPPVVAQPTPPPAAAIREHAAAAPPGDDALLVAFLRGTGLTDAEPSDPVRMMEVVGAALRAAVAGIRQTLIARASIKGEFRIEQTMVRASGNNPLKFSAGDDDAMAALLGIGRRNAMPADRAVSEALRDMRLHELATVSAMQIAVRALLAQFDPAGVEKGVGASTLDKMPGHRKARCWDAFIAMHGNVTQALSDDFDSVFGKAFARAYEQAMRDASAGDDRL